MPVHSDSQVAVSVAMEWDTLVCLKNSENIPHTRLDYEILIQYAIMFLLQMYCFSTSDFPT